MDKKKIIGLIASIIFVGAFAFCLSWTIINWDKVQQGMTGTNLYNQDDINNAYQDGYNTALTNEADYQAQIDGYRNTIANLNDQISSLNFTMLDLQSQVASLTSGNNDKAAMITSLNSQIATLNGSITSLTTQNSNLNTQVSNLTANLLSLTTDNTNLLLQVASLQSQISANAATIDQLNSLNAYLSSLVSELENQTEYIASFYVNGSLWDMQIMDEQNATATLPATPASNDWTFVGWSLDGVNVIDPTAVPVITNISFYAVINCAVSFRVENTIFNQTVLQNGYAVPPTSFTYTAGLLFMGWSVDGTNLVNVPSYPITANTIFTAVFSQQWTTVFIGSSAVKVTTTTTKVSLTTLCKYSSFAGKQIRVTVTSGTAKYTVILSDANNTATLGTGSQAFTLQYSSSAGTLSTIVATGAKAQTIYITQVEIYGA